MLCVLSGARQLGARPCKGPARRASSPQDKERRDTGSSGYLKSPSLRADNKQRVAGGRTAFLAALAAPGLRCE